MLLAAGGPSELPASPFSVTSQGSSVSPPDFQFPTHFPFPSVWSGFAHFLKLCPWPWYCQRLSLDEGLKTKCTEAQSRCVPAPVSSHPWASPPSLYFGNPQALQTRSGRTLLKTLPKTRFPINCPGPGPNKPIWWPCRERPRQAFWSSAPQSNHTSKPSILSRAGKLSEEAAWNSPRTCFFPESGCDRIQTHNQ